MAAQPGDNGKGGNQRDWSKTRGLSRQHEIDEDAEREENRQPKEAAAALHLAFEDDGEPSPQSRETRPHERQRRRTCHAPTPASTPRTRIVFCAVRR